MNSIASLSRAVDAVRKLAGDRRLDSFGLKDAQAVVDALKPALSEVKDFIPRGRK